MTTFQDPPPQSRRAVRQSERAENPDGVLPYSFDDAAPEASADASGAPRADAPSTGGHRAEAGAHVAPPTNRDAPGTPLAEPLNYMTQARLHPEPEGTPQAPAPAPTEQGQFRVRDYSPEGRRAAMSREQFSGVTSTPAPPPTPNPLLPVNSTPTTPSAPVPPSQVDLDYFTQGAPAVVPPAAVPPTSAEPTPAAAPASSDPNPFDHTMTRRELRELRAAQERAAEAQRRSEPILNILNSGPIPIPVLSVQPGHSQALAEAMAEFDELARKRTDLELPTPPVAAQAAPTAEATPTVTPASPVLPTQNPEPAAAATTDEQVAAAPPVAPASEAQPFPFRLTAPSAAEPPAEAAFVPPPLVEPQPLPTGPLENALREPELVSLADLAPGLAAPDALAQPSQEKPVQEDRFVAQPPAPATPPVDIAPPAPALAPPVFDDPVPEPQQAETPAPARHDTPVGSADAVFIEPDRSNSRPVGHWSVQAELEDDDLGLENTISRTVGAGTAAITTSALVLPSVPEMGDLLHPFTSTGEILVTGSIDLPRSLGTTGAHPHRVDNSDFEDDPLDSQVVSTDSAPVRAIRAISTHTSTRGVIEQKRRQSSRMPAVMIVVASVLALGVVSLLVVAFATGLFH